MILAPVLLYATDEQIKTLLAAGKLTEVEHGDDETL
jgi:hypothetical protein